MKEKTAKGFKLPKIRKQESKDNLRYVDVKSRDCQELVSNVRRTYLNSNFETVWTLKSAAFVENRELEQRYRAKKLEWKEDGRPARDMADHFAILALRDNVPIQGIVKQGLHCRQMSYNGLGDSKSGVYLWRNADVQFRTAESWDTATLTVMVFKIMLGKCKPIPPPSGSDAVIEPTPNYDCHMPQIVAKPSDAVNTQTARSQVYLYEYTEDCEPSAVPRQCLPYAVLVYEKPENAVKKPTSTPVDRYSVRPSERHRSETSTETDTEKSTENKEPKMPVYDPMSEPAETRPQAAYSESIGLCVPRLTSGLPFQRDLPPAVVSGALPLTDPRSQLSFLASEGPLKQHVLPEYPYQPSFGPSDDEQDEKEQEIMQEISLFLNKPKMPSLPPIELPVVTDTRLLRDPRFENKQVDPRLENKPHGPRVPPQADPRLNRPKDPRINRQDPRLQRLETNARPNNSSLKTEPRKYFTNDPRLFKNVETAGQDDSAKVKKKLSLHDYKKKVNVEKPDSPQDPKEGTKTGEKEDTISAVTGFDDDFLEDLDLRPATGQPSNFLEPLEPHHASIIMNPNVDAVKYPQFQSGDGWLNKGNASPQAKWNETDDSKSPDSNKQDIQEEIVHKPDDMAKALNELSDPDDASQSPKHIAEPEAMDPLLAEAMKKLVEHSANVNLFTEALKSLQDSADKYGEQLHDPEFLVKKIAEEIEVLSAKEKEKERLKAEQIEQERLKAERIERERIQAEIERQRIEAEMTSRAVEPELEEEEKQAEDYADIQSPDAIMSPDRSYDYKDDSEGTVKYIPLESTDDNSATENKMSEKSVLEEAMKKTLAELSKVERKDVTPRERKVPSELESTDIDLKSIPIPPDLPKDTKAENGLSKNKTKEMLDSKQMTHNSFSLFQSCNVPPSSKIKGIKDRIEVVPMDLDDDLEDEDIDLRSGFPTHHNLLPDCKGKTAKSKPQIKINLKFHSESKDSASNDEDLRTGVGANEAEKTRGSIKEGEISESIKAKDMPDKKYNSAKDKCYDMFEDDHDDPFGLGVTEDVDERFNQESKPGSKSWVKVTHAFGDVDLRTSAENSHENTQEDFDLRKSHSRSASPTPHQSKVTVDQTQSAVPASDAMKKTDSSTELPGVSQDSNSSEGSGMLFDAYSLGKKSEDSKVHSNDYGDVDWRISAKHSVNDFDMRTVHSEQKPGAYISNLESEAFSQLNKSIQNMFNPEANAYKVNKSNGDYKMYIGQGLLPSATSQRQSSGQTQGNVQNLMHDLDFSNLKTILANVQQTDSGQLEKTTWMKDPTSFTETGNTRALDWTKDDTGNSDNREDSGKDEDEEPLPAIPGFGDLKEPATDEKERITVTARKNVENKDNIVAEGIEGESIEKSDFWLNRKTYTSKPKLISPVNDKAPLQDEDRIIDKSGTGEDGCEAGTLQDSAPCTPKDKIHYEDDLYQEVTPLPNISYQSALLESMEQSALKVRSDDFDLYEETPFKSKSHKAERKRTFSGNMKDSPVTKQIKKDDPKECHVQENDGNVEDCVDDDDDDDDDEGGLVIDLSPVDKSTEHTAASSPVPAEPNNLKMDKITNKADNSKTDHTEVEVQSKKEEILNDDDGSVPKSKEEMASMIENSRKNMVIKLKGETKKVNPKTGKIYDEVIKGSAIQVLGQPAKAYKSDSKTLSSKEFGSSKVKSVCKTGRASPIPTISGGVVRSPSPIQIGTTVPVVPLSLPISRPMYQNMTQGIHIPTIGSGGLPQPQMQQNSFIHPYTGQIMSYGNTSSRPNLASVPREGDGLLLVSSQQRLSQINQNLVHVPQMSYGAMQSETPIGMAIQTIRQQSISAEAGATSLSRSKLDPLHWFSDKIDKPETGQNGDSDVRRSENISKAQYSRTTAVKQVQLDMDSSRKQEYSRKRSNDDSDIDSDVKKVKVKQEATTSGTSGKNGKRDVDKNLNNFGSRILETLSEVTSSKKSNNKESTKNDTSVVSKTETSSEKKADAIVIDSEESELEDGEISDDSDTEDIPPPYTDTRVVQESFYRGNYNEDRRYSNYNYNSPTKAYESPKRIVHFRDRNQCPIPTIGSRNFQTARHVGAEWADFIQNPNNRVEERVRATKIESPSLLNSRNTNLDETDLLSKSAASINKSKQKFVAQSQVKTLEEWLKIELETDNIQPLESILPYPLDTDLSVISKPRRRKIRLRVKNVIEQEGLRRAKGEQEKTESFMVQPIQMEPAVPPTPAVIPNHLPEVHNDELERELQMLGNAMIVVKNRVEQMEKKCNGQFTAASFSAAERLALVNDKRLLVAMTLVESEMRQLLVRTCFFGYPHRRVPNELLLSTELNTFKSAEADVFLILMMPISAKPYAKLSQLKSSLDSLTERLKHADSEAEKDSVTSQIKSQHIQRQSLLRSFTGYLNKKRIGKIQETADKYTLVFEYFKAKTSPTRDSVLKHIRTTQMDLRQHLILAKQYLAMDEMRK